MARKRAGRLIFRGSLLLLAAGVAGTGLGSSMAQDARSSGRQSYLKYCAECHGEAGRGDGPKAPNNPRPRDLTSGIFKFRSTPTGSLPTEEDLMRTITQGVPGTEMRAWDALSQAERRALVEYIKTFSPRWKAQKPQTPISLPSPPGYLRSQASVAKGQALFRDAECTKCHGDNGEGDGPSADELKDDWGHPIKPADFTTGRFKSGPSPRDLYRSIATGIGGTPMASFQDSLSEEEIWHLVSFILSLKGPF
jgi:cytochrome c oxidase cbb3-type subunit 2